MAPARCSRRGHDRGPDQDVRARPDPPGSGRRRAPGSSTRDRQAHGSGIGAGASPTRVQGAEVLVVAGKVWVPAVLTRRFQLHEVVTVNVVGPPLVKGW